MLDDTIFLFLCTALLPWTLWHVHATDSTQPTEQIHMNDKQTLSPFSVEAEAWIENWSREVEPSRIERALVHKQHDKNVFVARIDPLSPTRCIAELQFEPT